ncbi:MAG: hypothetical protein LQ346_006197 [Caloplaca aetnensis]|nr:MAG: hypothetical protein LQ346_006197 [Caloplaca aetnensis]
MCGTDKGKYFKYRNKLRHTPCNIKMGGAHYVDEYSGFTHQLLAKPNKIGTVQWSQNSTLVILKSSDYLPYARGSTLHIQAYGKEDAQSLVSHLSAWYAKGGAQILEIPSHRTGQSVSRYGLTDPAILGQLEREQISTMKRAEEYYRPLQDLKRCLNSFKIPPSID